MRCILFTDAHGGQTSSVLREMGKRYSYRLENLLDILKWLKEMAEKNNCDRIICLGDMFDKPDLTAEEITAINTIDLSNFEFVIGNHEAISNDLGINSVNLFRTSRIYDKPTLEDLGNVQLVFLPYVTEQCRQPLSDTLKSIGATLDRPIYMLSHNDIKGVQYGTFLSTCGYDKDEILQNVDLFINGHIHNGSWVEEGRILNLGAIDGINFSSDATDWVPRAAILDTDTSYIDFLYNPYAFRFYKKDFSSILNPIDCINRFLNSLDKTTKNVISIKVDSKHAEEANSLIKSIDWLYYSRMVVNYSDQEVVTEVRNESNSVSLDFNYVDKFRDFIAAKHKENDSLNYEIMIEEINKAYQN